MMPIRELGTNVLTVKANQVVHLTNYKVLFLVFVVDSLVVLVQMVRVNCHNT
ncbi:hypothetical protein LguiB_021833 [Lonicera macranthoides]